MKKKILVIEDETAIREIVKDYFNRLDFEVSIAVNGKEGLFDAIIKKPDIIICDLMMPEMDGYEVLKHVRQHEEIGDTPFILLTAKTEHADIRLGMKGGADDYLTKPFVFEELRDAVLSCLKRATRVRESTQDKIRQFTKEMQQATDHEFNTPLNTIFGFAEIIIQQSNVLSKEQIVEFVKKMFTSGKRLQRTVKKLAIYQAIVSSKITGNNEYIGKCAIYTNIVNQIINRSTKEASKNVNFNVLLESSELNVAETALDIIIYEITDNAVKFSNDNSEIIVTGKIVDDRYRLIVKNYGYGMTAGQIEKIDAFVQFDRASREQQGSGLGLFIAKSLTEMNGGKFSVNSKVNEFLEIIFEFRISKQLGIRN